MIDEFDVNVDDDSGYELATQIMRARSQCAIGDFDEVNKLAQRFHNLKGKKVEQLFKKAEDEDQDTDWESGDEDGDDDSGDIEMSDASAQPRQKQEPEVDEDGFTKVTHQKK